MTILRKPLRPDTEVDDLNRQFPNLARIVHRLESRSGNIIEVNTRDLAIITYLQTKGFVIV